MPVSDGDTRGDNLWLLRTSAVLLLVLLPFSGYVTSLPFIQSEWSLSNSQAGTVFSLYLVGFALSALVLVPMADRANPRRLMLAGVSLMVGGNLLFPLVARDIWTGSLLRFLVGAGNVVVYVLGIRLVSQRFTGRKRGTAVAVFVGTGYAGTTGSYTLMGILLNLTSSWRMAYFVASLASTASLALMLATFEKEPPRPGPSDTPARAIDQDVRRWRGPDFSIVRSRPVVLVIIAYALHTAELYLARLWLPLLLGAALVEHGRSAAEATSRAATLSGLMFMTGIVGVLGGGFLSDRVGRSSGAMLIFSSSGALSFLIGWLVGAPLAALLAVGFAYGFVTAADSAVYSTAAVELSPPGRIASVQAVQTFVGFAAGAVIPVIAGSILDLVESPAAWGAAFSFSGGLAIAGVIALSRLRRLMRAAPVAAND